MEDVKCPSCDEYTLPIKGKCQHCGAIASEDHEYDVYDDDDDDLYDAAGGGEEW